MKLLIELFSTCLFIGYLPASGTIATLASFPLVVFLDKQPVVFRILLILILTLIAGITITIAETKIFKLKDAREIVIDEVIGFLIATFMIDITKLHTILVAFLIFRLLDITKVGVIKKVQKIPSSVGVLADDIICGLITNFILRIIQRWL
ncbi:MAG: phosphatidylglycerophosphatase A [Endomicrobia bacterium]|nr:phosphatidylglycerophosphatase A [Endomicrobiia bacterium]MCX7941180.1 phosphatidylglycerophosphatase A [Endomicrobiia bacterium]MDW8056212.1 phosphatidylglycerophosphatase A [Elusimicrobiota bacterium]